MNAYRETKEVVLRLFHAGIISRDEAMEILPKDLLGEEDA
jgi:hypothetical protein